MRHKYVGSLAVLTLLFLLTSFAGQAQAQSELLFGQSHYYSVVFRGNGEAIVYARLVLTNPNETAMTAYSFELPKVQPSEMVIYQQNIKPGCIRYDYGKPIPTDGTSMQVIPPEQTCLEYQEPDYMQNYPSYAYPYQGNPQTEYKKISFVKTGSQYSFNLPYPIAPYKSGAVIISYAAQGYVQNTFGLFSFNFETLKVGSRIMNMRVAVDVDSDLRLKGKKSEINYAQQGGLANTLSAPSAGIASKQLDSIVSRIGTYGPLVKQATNLAPGESFTVKGEYAKSGWRLYLSSIIWTIVIVGLLLLIIYYLGKYIRQKRGEKSLTKSTLRAPSLGVINFQNVGWGLLSSALAIALTALLRSISTSYLYSVFNSMMAPITLIAVLLFYVLIIFGPAVYVGAKHGWKAFLAVIVAEFLWLVLYIIVYLVLFQSGINPVPYSGGGVMLDIPSALK